VKAVFFSARGEVDESHGLAVAVSVSFSAVHLASRLLFLCSRWYLEIDLRACADRRARLSSHPFESLWHGGSSFWLALARKPRGVRRSKENRRGLGPRYPSWTAAAKVGVEVEGAASSMHPGDHALVSKMLQVRFRRSSLLDSPVNITNPDLVALTLLLVTPLSLSLSVHILTSALSSCHSLDGVLMAAAADSSQPSGLLRSQILLSR